MLDGYKRYLIGIAVVIGTVFLSQQSYSMEFGHKIYEPVANLAKKYLGNSTAAGLYNKAADMAKGRGEIIKKEIQNEKQKVSENILGKVKDYFSGVENSILHPGMPQNCQPAQSEAAQGNPTQPQN